MLDSHQDLQNIPFLIIFSKRDLAQHKTPTELSEFMVSGLNKQRRIRYESLSVRNQ